MKTTMTNSSPWDEIAVPGVDFNVRQVATNTPVPCYWARDAFGACVFIVELEGDFTSRFRADMVRVRGVKIDLRAEGKGIQRLVLQLERQVDRDLFDGLCRTLIDALLSATDSATALALALAHLRRWKRFLSGNAQHMSADEVRGLYAELVFLMEMLGHGFDHTAATSAWLGPERSQHDFVFGDVAVEIKSLAGTERNAVRISSEDQLESLKGELFLRIFRLSDALGATGARSLNGIVEAVRDKLADACAADDFDKKLAAYGYAPIPEYDEPHFVVSGTRTYRVAAEFPRLARSALPAGVGRVSYDVALEPIAVFKCDDSAMFGDA